MKCCIEKNQNLPTNSIWNIFTH